MVILICLNFQVCTLKLLLFIRFLEKFLVSFDGTSLNSYIILLKNQILLNLSICTIQKHTKLKIQGKTFFFHLIILFV